ncbi:MAG TPA: PilZ domain-containing protein [Hyphomicrobium sp.]|nr:PilZ domain-containing protein [Hyphomicrobium sp.]
MMKRTDFTDKRQFGRRQTQIRAWIRVAGRPPVPCTVRNLSEGGALLDCDDDVWLPFSFRLVTHDQAIDKVCEIRHQTGPRIGVQFVEGVLAPDHGGRILGDRDIWMGGTPLRR